MGGTAVVAYGLLLWRWFTDPGSPTDDGFLVRSRVIWPFVVVWAGLALGWVLERRNRLSKLAKEVAGCLRMERGDALLLALVMILAVLCQLPTFLNPGGVIDSDSALPGLIAKHIADGRPSTVFIYTMGYGGTFSSHVLALVYTLTAASVMGLLVVTRGFYLLFIAATFVLARAALGRWVALAAGIWLAVPPHFLLTQLSYPEFAEILALGMVGLALIVFWVAERIQDDLVLAAAGLMFGIGFWTQPLITSVAAAGALGIVLLAGPLRFFSRLPHLGIAFLMGVFPMLIPWGRNITDFGRWLVIGDDSGDAPMTAWQSFTGLWKQGFAVNFGPFGAPELDPLAATLVTVAVIVPSIWAVLVGLRSWHRRRGGDGKPLAAAALVILGLTVPLHLAFYLLSPFNSLIVPPRYLVPLYVGAPVMLAFAVADLVRRIVRHEGTGGMAAIVVMVLLAALGLKWSVPWMAEVAGRHDDRVSSVRDLEEQGIRYCEAPFWDAYWLTFVSLEEIICASAEVVRDPYYRTVLERNNTAPFPTLVTGHGHPLMQDALEFARANDVPHEHFVTSIFEVVRFDVEQEP